MSNSWFQFKQFTIKQDKCAMKVGTDGVLLGAWTDVTDIKRIMDIGTGTGLVALMLAQRSNAMIDAIEPEPDSYKQAIDNCNDCPWQERITIYNMTLQEFQTDHTSHGSGQRKYDLVVSNPPYFINSGKNPDAKRSLSRHADSLSRKELLKGVTFMLKRTGRFCLILPAVEAELFIDSARKQNLFCTRKLFIKAVPNKDIKRILMQFEWQEKMCEEETIVIESGGRHNYSEEYRKLTQEFYLGF